MVQIDSLVTFRPEGVGGWTMSPKSTSIIKVPSGNPSVKDAIVVKSQVKNKDILTTSSANFNLNLAITLEAATYLALQQDVSRLNHTIMVSSLYALDLYFYNPDTKDRVLYDSVNFPEASYMMPLADPAVWKWVLISLSDQDDAQDPNNKFILKQDGNYQKKLTLTFRGVRQ